MINVKQKIARFFGIETGTKPQIVNLLRPRMLWNMASYFLFRRFNLISVSYYPINLMVEISTFCNFSCPGCERELYKEELGGLPKENVKLENLKKLSSILPYVYSVYFVSGLGEPFCNKEFWDIHRFFKSFGIKTGYFSNASLITQYDVEKTFVEKVNNVTLSIDTHIKKKYEKIKKGASFEKMLETILLFSQCMKKYGAKSFQLGLNYIFRSDNYQDILPFLDLAHRLKVDFVLCTSLITHVEREQSNSFFVADYHEKYKVIQEAKTKAKKLGIGFKVPELLPEGNVTCECLWRHLSIFYNGVVCACPYFRTDRDFYFHVKDKKIINEKRRVTNNILGNYLRDDFKNIWNGPRMQQLRRSELKLSLAESPCDCCYYKYKCH